MVAPEPETREVAPRVQPPMAPEVDVMLPVIVALVAVNAPAAVKLVLTPIHCRSVPSKKMPLTRTPAATVPARKRVRDDATRWSAYIPFPTPGAVAAPRVMEGSAPSDEREMLELAAVIEAAPSVKPPMVPAAAVTVPVNVAVPAADSVIFGVAPDMIRTPLVASTLTHAAV